MKERVPNRYNPEEVQRLWGVLPREVKNVIHAEYKIRDPELTDYEREEIRKLHRELEGKMTPDHEQAYAAFMDIAVGTFGPMPPIPGIPHQGTIYGTGKINR